MSLLKALLLTVSNYAVFAVVKAIVAIWSINTLFSMGIEYNLVNFLAALGLVMLFQPSISLPTAAASGRCEEKGSRSATTAEIIDSL